MGAFDPAGALLRGFALAQQINQQKQRNAFQERSIQLSEEREARFKQQEAEQRERQARIDQRNAELQDLQTRLSIRREGGKLLTKEERERLKQGPDFSIGLGDGMATTASSGETLTFGDNAYFLPSREVQQDIDLQQQLERARQVAEVGSVPIPETLASLGLPAGTRVQPSVLDDLIRAQAATRPEPTPQKLQAFQNDDGTVSIIDLASGQVTNRIAGAGKRTKPTGQQTASQQKEERIVAAASKALRFAGSLEEAEKRLKRSNDQFVQANLTRILRELRALEPRQQAGSALDVFFGPTAQPTAQENDPFAGLTPEDIASITKAAGL